MINKADKIRLGKITTRDEAGRHFTEIFGADWLASMEDEGYLTIHRPVHETGIPYSQEHWSVEVAPVVGDWFGPDGKLICDGPPRTRYEVAGDTVTITYPDGQARSYRTVGHEHGYVYDVTDHPGTSGQQVLDPRAPTGTTLMGPRDGQALAALLRRCLRVARGQAVRREYCEASEVRL